MRLLYIADGRSPIALNWMSYFIQAGHEIHLVSTFPCESVMGVTSQQAIPVGLSDFYGTQQQGGKGGWSFLRRLLPPDVRTRIRQLAAPFTFPQVTRALQGIIEMIQPDLIHAMRMPYEGMITSEALKQIGQKRSTKKSPFLVSVWGNDLTLHARSTPVMASYTKRTLKRCDALHTDCQRDQRLAIEWGFEPGKPKIILPGGGGVRMDIFHPPDYEQDQGGESSKAPVTVINPRGFRAYVRNDTFFHAIPLVVEKHPEVHFICPDMEGEGQAEKWVEELRIRDRVELLPPQSRQEMAELFRQAQISLSITTHDGTPNTLLEAMASGSFPIAGDIKSIREWIEPGMNGLLVDPGEPEALARAILEAVAQPELRRRAMERNLELVRERAEYGKCMRAGEEFCIRLVEMN